MSLGQVIRYGAVGLFNTVSGLAVIYALKLFAGAGDVLANSIGYAAGMAISFGLNGGWTFNYQGAQIHALGRFVVTMAVSYSLNLLTVLLAIHHGGLNPYVAQALGVPPFTLCSFLLSKYWVFKVQA